MKMRGVDAIIRRALRMVEFEVVIPQAVVLVYDCVCMYFIFIIWYTTRNGILIGVRLWYARYYLFG